MTGPLVPIVALVLLAVPLGAVAQTVSTEYRVKAAFLYNFVKFVDWPNAGATGPPTTGPIDICVAGRNPFDTVLEETVQGERVADRPLRARVILEPDSTCHVVFLPEGANRPAYLRALQGLPILTVGETTGFIAEGGLVRFYLDGAHVRFEINRQAAERAGLRISSRLLTLARIVTDQGSTK